MVGITYLLLKVKGTNPNVNNYIFHKLINLHYNATAF